LEASITLADSAPHLLDGKLADPLAMAAGQIDTVDELMAVLDVPPGREEAAAVRAADSPAAQLALIGIGQTPDLSPEAMANAESSALPRRLGPREFRADRA
jgi:hypothetical protein